MGDGEVDSRKKSRVYRDTDHAQVTSVLPDGDIPFTDHALSADESVLVALGYKQEFKREFSLWTTFLRQLRSPWSSPFFASTLYYGMSNPPPAP